MSQETLLQDGGCPNSAPRTNNEYADRPVGVWALIPVAVLLLSFALTCCNQWIVNLLYGLGVADAWVYTYGASVLIGCAFVISAAIAYAMLGKGGSKIGLILLFAWAVLLLFLNCFGLIVTLATTGVIEVLQYPSAMAVINGFIRLASIFAQILLFVFLVMRLIKTSAYKLPLIVAVVGVVLGLINTVASSILLALHQVEAMTFVQIASSGQTLVMAVAFLLMFFASRKLAKMAN